MNPIPRDHLRSCPDHGVVDTHDGEVCCPCCETGVEARPGAVTDVEFGTLDLQWQIKPSTMVDLIQCLERDAERNGLAPVYVAVAEIPESDLAAGYTRQERWFNVAVAETGGGERTIIKHEREAREAAEIIHRGGEYLEPTEGPTQEHVTAEAWRGVAEAYCKDVEYEQVADDTLHIHMSGFGSDSGYKTARRELGYLADGWGLNIRTIEAGGRFSDGKVEVSLDG